MTNIKNTTEWEKIWDNNFGRGYEKAKFYTKEFIAKELSHYKATLIKEVEWMEKEIPQKGFGLREIGWNEAVDAIIAKIK